MSVIFRLGIFVSLFVSVYGVAQTSFPLGEFSESYLRDFVQCSDAEATVKDGVMTVRTGHSRDWPGVTLAMEKSTLDLLEYGQISLDVKNLSAESLTLHLRVDDVRRDHKHSLTGSIELGAGKSGILTTKLSSTPWLLDEPLELVGMRGYPKYQDKLDTSKISQVIIFVAKPKKSHAFEIQNLRAEGETQRLEAKGFIPFVDKFGQFKHADWPGKIHSEQALLDAKKAEQKDLSAHSSPEHWNQYGGWTKGPKLKATGFFRVEKQDGLWWLVDPDGYLFWSHGVDCLNFNSVTPVSEREHYFDWLPEDKSPFARFYGRGKWAPHGFYNGKQYRHFDFAASNLMRKYGEDFHDDYALLCHHRLRSWGMNTIGNWSNGQIKLKRKTPYVATIHFYSRPIQGSQGYWGKFYDVFDPAFRASLKKRLQQEQGKSVGDPWCIGFFVDNELSWGNDISLATAALMSPADQPAKIEFVKVLKAKYDTIEKLNDVWGVEYASWDALRKSKDKPDEKKARDDLTAFYTVIAETYFKTVREELKALAPDQLYLGCRFAWVNDRAAMAAGKYCDVVSYNRYTYGVESLRMPDGIDKPLIIGEFHFGALDRGLFHTGLVSCTDQTDRAQKYREYVYGALRNPYIVGTHWFQYRDQALTGRGDGENYQIGLVDGCDNPYPETITMVREIGKNLYHYRYVVSHMK